MNKKRDLAYYIGNWTKEECPECKANILENAYGDKWCSYIRCEWMVKVEDRETQGAEL